MAKKILVPLITLLALVGLVALKGIERDKRQEAAKLRLIPAMLPSAYPAIGGCYEIQDEGPIYLYFENGERKTSRTKPEGLKCINREPSRAGDSTPAPISLTQADLEGIAAGANKELPRMLDASTRADNVVIGPMRKLVNNITLTNVEPGGLAGSQLIKLLESEIKPKICANKEFSKIMSKGATVAFNYHDNRGNSISEIAIDQHACRMYEKAIGLQQDRSCADIGSARKVKDENSPPFRMYRCTNPDGSIFYTNQAPGNTAAAQ